MGPRVLLDGPLVDGHEIADPDKARLGGEDGTEDVAAVVVALLGAVVAAGPDLPVPTVTGVEDATEE
jgi:hypothetical protein